MHTYFVLIDLFGILLIGSICIFILIPVFIITVYRVCIIIKKIYILFSYLYYVILCYTVITGQHSKTVISYVVTLCIHS